MCENSPTSSLPFGGSGAMENTSSDGSEVYTEAGLSFIYPLSGDSLYKALSISSSSYSSLPSSLQVHKWSYLPTPPRLFLALGHCLDLYGIFTLIQRLFLF